MASKDVIPLLFRSSGAYFDKNRQLFETQIKTLDTINSNCYQEYQGMLEEVREIRASNETTRELISKAATYTEKINDLTQLIDQMEKEEEAMEQHIAKMEAKFKELETIKKYIGHLKKPVA